MTKLDLTKQLSDKRLEAARWFVSEHMKDPSGTQDKLKDLMVEVNALKAQIKQLESA